MASSATSDRLTPLKVWTGEESDAAGWEATAALRMPGPSGHWVLPYLVNPANATPETSVMPPNAASFLTLYQGRYGGARGNLCPPSAAPSWIPRRPVHPEYSPPLHAPSQPGFAL